MRSVIVFFLLIFLTSLIFTTQATAKVLPQARGKTNVVPRVASSGITVSPRLRNDRKALIINFGNLHNATSVSYTLVYKTSGQEEGVGGTISQVGNSATRELLFGTCSGNVCRYHTHITNARLEVTYTKKTGKKFLKRYRIKV